MKIWEIDEVEARLVGRCTTKAVCLKITNSAPNNERLQSSQAHRWCYHGVQEEV